jgi:hypothetical protein
MNDHSCIKYEYGYGYEYEKLDILKAKTKGKERKGRDGMENNSSTGIQYVVRPKIKISPSTGLRVWSRKFGTGGDDRGLR